jgi:hypothetical protein
MQLPLYGGAIFFLEINFPVAPVADLTRPLNPVSLANMLLLPGLDISFLF